MAPDNRDDATASGTETRPLASLLPSAGRIAAADLRDFCTRVLQTLGVPQADADVTAEALVTADLRGIDSHGTAHLRRYVAGLRNGSINARPSMQIQGETPSTALLDGDHGLGFVVGYRGMQLAIEKARQAGTGWVVARRSTHYGAAGYWAGLAVEQGMIGISMTVATAHVAPTFASRAALGTNPIAIGVPAGHEPPFLLDMATSVVPMGRLEVYTRLGKPLPLGWLLDTSGTPITDAAEGFRMAARCDAILMPLGGAGDAGSGYKGYGLGLGVEILTSLLAGYAGEVRPNPHGEPELGQFFGAMRVDAFRPLAEFAAAMDGRLAELKAMPTLPGAERVMVAGQKEWESTQERIAHGIPLHPLVQQELAEIGKQLGLAF
jgi:L-2-hydroxycarboxylate dehydrogenase (NAD+)